MTLLDRYVYAVRLHLPKAQQDDIAAELRDSLQWQIEAEELERGKSLSEEEVSTVLKKLAGLSRLRPDMERPSI